MLVGGGIPFFAGLLGHFGRKETKTRSSEKLGCIVSAQTRCRCRWSTSLDKHHHNNNDNEVGDRKWTTINANRQPKATTLYSGGGGGAVVVVVASHFAVVISKNLDIIVPLLVGWLCVCVGVLWFR